MKHGRPRQRSGEWERKARALVAEHPSLDLAGVLAMHDHIADLLEWEGADRASAEFYAWEQAVEYLVPRRVS